MERVCSINLIDLQKEVDSLHDFKISMIQSALLSEGIRVSEEFITAIIQDDLDSIAYTGSNGKPLRVHEIEFILDIGCAVELLFTLLKADTFSVSFATASAFISQICRDRSIRGLHIPIVYATDLQGFGDKIQSNFTSIISSSGATADLEETLKVCSGLVKFMSSDTWFVLGNNIISYLLTNGYLFMQTGNIYLLDDADGEGDIREEYTGGCLFEEYIS